MLRVIPPQSYVEGNTTQSYVEGNTTPDVSRSSHVPFKSCVCEYVLFVQSTSRVSSKCYRQIHGQTQNVRYKLCTWHLKLL